MESSVSLNQLVLIQTRTHTHTQKKPCCLMWYVMLIKSKRPEVEEHHTLPRPTCCRHTPFHSVTLWAMVSLGSAGRFNSSQRGICLSHSYSFFIPPSLIQHPDPQVPASTSARRHLFLLKQTLHPSSPCLGAKSFLFVLHHPLSDESWQKTKNRTKMMHVHVRENEGPKRKP